MIGRLVYYLSRFRRVLENQGPKVAAAKVLDFLARRRVFLGFLFESIEYHVISRFRDLDATRIQSWTFSSLPSGRVLIYVSFDAHSEIRPPVIEQLEAFQRLGYQTIFVSTSPQLGPSQLDSLRNSCHMVIHRKNLGYDFCSWKLGYQALSTDRGAIESLILMNDSCFGPSFDLQNVLQQMRQAPGAVFGITKSYEIDEYIQSYFFHFGKDLLRTALVDRFFDRIRILNSKWAIVRYFEIGSSRFFRRRRVPLLALVDPREPRIAEIMKRHSQTDPVVDPVGKIWNELGISPFYKRSNLAREESEKRSDPGSR